MKSLIKEKEFLTSELNLVRGKLSNEKFVSKAPEKLVAAEKEKEKSGEPTDIEAGIFAEKRKLTKEQRIKLELENRLRKGELFEASIVEEVYSRDLITVKTKLEDLPKSMSIDLSRETDPLKCEIILSDKIREILQELSQYDSKLFYKDDERLLESEEVAE